MRVLPPQRKGFRRHGALGKVVGHPLGDLSGRRFLGVRVFDIALHAWDLAVAIGRDATLEEALVEAVLHTVRQESLGMGFGIEPCGDVGPDASALEDLDGIVSSCSTCPDGAPSPLARSYRSLPQIAGDGEVLHAGGWC